MTSSPERTRLVWAAGALLMATCFAPASAQSLGERWGTAEEERKYYRVVSLPTPEGEVIEAGAFEVLSDGRLAVGTRRGDVFLVDGVDDPKPDPGYERFATGLDEVFGLAERDGVLYATHSAEVTRLVDEDADDRADRFETVCDDWGYANYHEYAFGSKFDADGNLFVALGLSMSYHSWDLFRGWIMRVSASGESTPIASGLRSPGGIGFNEHGALFYTESQGPWNSSCSLKAVEEGSFHGHPASFNWYPYAPHLGDAPTTPKPGGRIIEERERVPELTPYAVIFPYIRMGRSISGFVVDRSNGAFGPFQDQIFVGDFTLSLIMRATTERVNGVWQGACYPFREELSTGLLDMQFTPGGHLVCGGTNRGWPVRGMEPFCLERLEWTGVTPFEIQRIEIAPDGFKLRFTKAVERESASDPANYSLERFTHIYRGAYGGPEVDREEPAVESVELAEDGLSARIVLEEELLPGFVYGFDLASVRDEEGGALVHAHAFYTVNSVPTGPGTGPAADPAQSDEEPVVSAAPEPARWLEYEGGEGPGKGRHIVLVAGDQEYRSEQSLPMLARTLSRHHGFHCTVLFCVNEEGLVDPTLEVGKEEDGFRHRIPGLEKLAEADLAIFLTRFMILDDEQRGHMIEYLDSGKPMIGLRTANHGFLNLRYEVDGKRVRFGDDVLGGAFRGHHGRWHQDSTRGIVVPENADHPILRGVDDVWGPSDVYRTYPKGQGLPEGCTPLLMGQPLMGRSHDDDVNEDLIALPVAWTKTWRGASGQDARVFQCTMGSAKDFESAGLRRLVFNAAYWCLGLEAKIDPKSSVEVIGEYAPLASGFNYPKLGVKPRPVSSLR
ncbi:MAG: ThuA domain-containing protein [Planctomycetota bacterium]